MCRPSGTLTSHERLWLLDGSLVVRSSPPTSLRRLNTSSTSLDMGTAAAESDEMSDTKSKVVIDEVHKSEAAEEDEVSAASFKSSEMSPTGETERSSQLLHRRLHLSQLRESQSPTLLSKLLIQRLEWKSRKWISERKNV